MSGGRAIQSQARLSPLNSSLSSRNGARESSPKRISLRSPRTKSATSQNGFIPAPSFSQRGFRPRRQREENHKLQGHDGFQDRRQTRLQTNKEEQRDHGEPLPAGATQPFQASGKSE